MSLGIVSTPGSTAEQVFFSRIPTTVECPSNNRWLSPPAPRNLPQHWVVVRDFIVTAASPACGRSREIYRWGSAKLLNKLAIKYVAWILTRVNFVPKPHLRQSTTQYRAYHPPLFRWAFIKDFPLDSIFHKRHLPYCRLQINTSNSTVTPELRHASVKVLG